MYVRFFFVEISLKFCETMIQLNGISVNWNLVRLQLLLLDQLRGAGSCPVLAVQYVRGCTSRNDDDDFSTALVGGVLLPRSDPCGRVGIIPLVQVTGESAVKVPQQQQKK